MEDRKVQEREKFNAELIEATKPEKTGTFCFDGFLWDEKMPILKLMGDHGTPDFALTFLRGGLVNVNPINYLSWDMTVESTYNDYKKLVQDVLATMAVIQIKLGI